MAGGKPAVFVMGNHEPWNGELQHERQVARRAAEELGVTLLDDNEVELAGVSFVGGTLWADGRLRGQDVRSDEDTGKRIRVTQHDGGTRLITNGAEVILHGRTRGVIEAAMARPREGRLVVVTHHAPHPLCLPARQRSGWRLAIPHRTCPSSPIAGRLRSEYMAICTTWSTWFAPAGPASFVTQPGLGSATWRSTTSW